MTRPCDWQFHGVDRADNGDGLVTLELTGWRYTSREERDPGGEAACRWCAEPIVRAGRDWLAAAGAVCADAGMFGRHEPVPLPAIARAARPCVVRVVRASEWVESGPAGEMVAEHLGPPYTVVWQGRGWTVELATGYPLWRVTA